MRMLSLEEFARGLLRLGATLEQERRDALDDIGADVADRAREKVGTLQPGIGPFPAWAPLAESTGRSEESSSPSCGARGGSSASSRKRPSTSLSGRPRGTGDARG